MSKNSRIPELKQILGSLIFGAPHPMTLNDMRRNLVDVAKEHGENAAAFADVKPADIRDALTQIKAEIEEYRPGFHLVEVAGGYRFQTDDACGPWLRHLLNAGKPHRLSHPALETLAIIAYRQPVTRAEIEAVRGVNVDHIVRLLAEMQLIRIVGRSNLPGRPMLYGTTRMFLEHFGIGDLKDLPGIEELARIDFKHANMQDKGKTTEENGKSRISDEAGKTT